MAETRPSPESAEMTLFEHLADLRTVLLQSVVAVGILSIASWFVSERAVEILVDPALAAAGDLVFLSPTGAFMLRMKAAFGLGLFLAAPFVIWRLWSFVVPGLLQRERKVLVPVTWGSLLLFYVGVAFAYFVILPISLTFLLGFGTAHLQPMISAEHYFDFAIRLALAFGAVFQFPLVVGLLTYWEFLAPDFLRRYWRYGVVVVFVISAVLTPPDVASQLLMAGPVLLLYVLSMGVAQWISRAKRSR
jgi:sec-independent protein translocase protein TatC